MIVVLEPYDSNAEGGKIRESCVVMGGEPDTVETRFGRVRPSSVSSKSAAAGSHRTAASRRCRVISEDDDSPMDGVTEGPACEVPPAPSPEPTGTPPAAASRRSSPAVSQQPPRPRSSAAVPAPLDMEADISLLQPVTFSTIQRAPPEPMLRLTWHHKVNLIGEPVLNPLIHVCEMCDCPILSYGRMIPCKHVFCYDCAVSQDKCGHCGDRLVRVERAGLGKLFLCLQDGKRYNNSGCRRTYLSQRDLQAHINHRHRRQTGPTSAEKSSAGGTAALSRQDSSSDHRSGHHESGSTRAVADPRTLHDEGRQRDPRAAGTFAARARHQPPPQPIPVMTTQRSGNLISIPIQGHHPPPPQYAAAPPAFYQTTPPPPAAGAVVYNRNYPPAQYPSPWGTLPPAALSHPPPRYYH